MPAKVGGNRFQKIVFWGRVSFNGTKKIGHGHGHQLISIEIIKEQGKRTMLISMDWLAKDYSILISEALTLSKNKEKEQK